MYRLWAHASSSLKLVLSFVSESSCSSGLKQSSSHLIHFCGIRDWQYVNLSSVTQRRRFLLKISHQCWPFRNSQLSLNADPYAWSWIFLSLRFCFLRNRVRFPFGSVVEVRFLEGALSLEGSSRKALRPGGEDSEVPFPHSTRSPQLGSEWSWLGNPSKTSRNPSEGGRFLFGY